jgi:hypothetical protein
MQNPGRFSQRPSGPRAGVPPFELVADGVNELTSYTEPTCA